MLAAAEREAAAGEDLTSVVDLNEQIRKLEEDYAAKDVSLSGRIIHVAHYLPIIATLDAKDYTGVSTPPRTPDRQTPSLVSNLKETAQSVLPASLQPAASSTSSLSPEETTTPKWSFAPRRGHTAMHSGIRSLSATHEQIMVGWTGPILVANSSPSSASSFQSGEGATPITAPTSTISDKDKASLDEQVLHYKDEASADSSLKPMSFGSVWLDDTTAHDHYEGFCKKTLWPLFHYLLWQDVTTELPVEDNDWNAYVRANEAYAKRVAELYKPGDLIWIHDYHCLLVPRFLRQLIPDAYIGLFVHTPFPSSEVFRCLPSECDLHISFVPCRRPRHRETREAQY